MIHGPCVQEPAFDPKTGQVGGEGGACQEQIDLLRAKLNGLVGKTMGAEIFCVLLREAYGECVRSERAWFDKWLESYKGDDDMVQYGDSGVAERLQPKQPVVDLRERLAYLEKAVSRLSAELCSLREQLQRYGISIGPPVDIPLPPTMPR